MKPVEEVKMPESNLPMELTARQAAADCQKFYDSSMPGTGSQVGTIAGATDVTGSRPAGTSTGTPTVMRESQVPPDPGPMSSPRDTTGEKKWGGS